MHTLQAAVKGPVGNIGALASLISKLNRYRPSLVVAVVDTLLEDMHESLLAPRPDAQQRRLCHARLLAECYNHQVIRSQLLFYALYLTVDLGARFRCAAACISCEVSPQRQAVKT